MGVFYNTRLCAFGLIFMLFIPSCNIVDVNVPYTEQINKSSTGYGIQTKSAIDSSESLRMMLSYILKQCIPKIPTL